MNSRDLLEKQIVLDAIHSEDTTVLASLLELLTDNQVYQALSDGNQEHIEEPVRTGDLCDDEVFKLLNEVVINGTIEDCQFEYLTNRLNALALNSPKTIDDLNDLVLPMVAEMVEEDIIKDCTDTDDSTEFDVQDIIVNKLAEKFGIVQD